MLEYRMLVLYNLVMIPRVKKHINFLKDQELVRDDGISFLNTNESSHGYVRSIVL